MRKNLSKLYKELSAGRRGSIEKAKGRPCEMLVVSESQRTNYQNGAGNNQLTDVRMG